MTVPSPYKRRGQQIVFNLRIETKSLNRSDAKEHSTIGAIPIGGSNIKTNKYEIRNLLWNH